MHACLSVCMFVNQNASTSVFKSSHTDGWLPRVTMMACGTLCLMCTCVLCCSGVSLVLIGSPSPLFALNSFDQFIYSLFHPFVPSFVIRSFAHSIAIPFQTQKSSVIAPHPGLNSVIMTSCLLWKTNRNSQNPHCVQPMCTHFCASVGRLTAHSDHQHSTFEMWSHQPC